MPEHLCCVIVSIQHMQIRKRQQEESFCLKFSCLYTRTEPRFRAVDGQQNRYIGAVGYYADSVSAQFAMAQILYLHSRYDAIQFQHSLLLRRINIYTVGYCANSVWRIRLLRIFIIGAVGYFADSVSSQQSYSALFRNCCAF